MDIKCLRKELGLTQQEFAGKIGVSLSAVQNWERVVKPRTPSKLAMEKIKVLIRKKSPKSAYPKEVNERTAFRIKEGVPK